MKNFLLLLTYLFVLNACTHKDKVSVLSNEDGMKLVVN